MIKEKGSGGRWLMSLLLTLIRSVLLPTVESRRLMSSGAAPLALVLPERAPARVRRPRGRAAGVRRRAGRGGRPAAAADAHRRSRRRRAGHLARRARAPVHRRRGGLRPAAFARHVGGRRRGGGGPVGPAGAALRRDAGPLRIPAAPHPRQRHARTAGMKKPTLGSVSWGGRGAQGPAARLDAGAAGAVGSCNLP